MSKYTKYCVICGKINPACSYQAGHVHTRQVCTSAYNYEMNEILMARFCSKECMGEAIKRMRFGGCLGFGGCPVRFRLIEGDT